MHALVRHCPPALLLLVLGTGCQVADAPSAPSAPSAPGAPSATAASSAAAPAPARAPAVAVVLAPVRRTDLPLVLRGVGQVRAAAEVTVRSQVTGVLTAVHFAEGDTVAAGQTLFSIDPRPLDQALRQAEAALAQAEADRAQAEAALVRDQARLDNAEVESRRYDLLAESGTVTRETAERARTELAAYRATVAAGRAAQAAAAASVEAARAGCENARVQRTYATIVAPIAGRTGRLGVDAGNLVKKEDDTLVRIALLRPVQVQFALPARHLAAIRAALPEAPAVAVVAEDGSAGTGVLDLIDNRVDAATGTIPLRAALANPDGALWPGQQVTVELRLGLERGVLAVPSQALRQGQKGRFLFVAEGGSARLRWVAVRREEDGLAIIDSGVAADEQVVVEGQHRLADGVPVAAGPATGPATSPASGAVAR